MINPSIWPNMLARVDHDIAGRIDIYYGRFIRVVVRHPYYDGKLVERASKRDGQDAAEIEQ
jgi:hypothetical protein